MVIEELFNKTVDSLKFDQYIKWAYEKDGIDGFVLALPPIQRGFVWKPYQIQELWDSLLRNMPIGAVLLQKFEEGDKARSLSSESKEVKEEGRGGYFLLDGQQRTLSMSLGRYGSPTHKLWIDFSEDGLNNSKYRLRVTTKYQPFGYSSDGKGRLSVSDRRAAYEYYVNEKKIKEEDFFDKAKPWKANDKDGQYIFEIKDLWNNKNIIEKVPEHIKKRVENFFLDLENLKKRDIPLVLVDRFDIDEGMKDNMTDPLTLLFERISSNGTKLSSEDLLFSMIKQEWPEAHNLVNDLQEKVGSLMKPTDFIMTAFRISILLYNNTQNEKNKITDNPKPNAAYFHRHLKTLLNSEKYGLKTLIQKDGRLIQVFQSFKDTIEYKNDFGIPKVMFPKLDLYLMQVLIYFIIKKDKFEVKKKELVRFIIFWMVNKPKTNVSSKSSKKAIELIDKNRTLQEIYCELTKESEDNGYLFYKIDNYKIQEPKESFLINPGERAIKYFSEEKKEFYHKFSTNIELLLWLQRDYISHNETIEGYNPLAIHDKDSVPYDFDHIVPQSNWLSLSTRGNSLDELKNEQNKKNFANLWIRRSLGNLIGNYRVLDSSTNRSRGDTPLEEEIKKYEFRYNDFCINKEDIEIWQKASPKENQYKWNDERLEAFQYVVEKRTLALYNKIVEDLEFESWNKEKCSKEQN